MRVSSGWAVTGFELALFALSAVVVVRRRLEVRLHPIGLLLAGIAAWGAIQVIAKVSVDRQATMEASLGWAVNCVAFSLGLTLTRERDIRQRFLLAQVVFALGLSVAA